MITILLALILASIIFFSSRFIFYMSEIWTEIGKVRVVLEIILKKVDK